VIVDSSALIAILRGEHEEAVFRSILEGRHDLWISAGTLIESRMIAFSLNVLEEFDDLLSELGIRVAPTDKRQAEIAIEAYTRYGKGRNPAGLNFGDLFAYALAKLRDEPLLFKGDDFSKTDVKKAT
jgi:ribonuclease VapC